MIGACHVMASERGMFLAGLCDPTVLAAILGAKPYRHGSEIARARAVRAPQRPECLQLWSRGSADQRAGT
jgi:hypothetical protein